MCDPLDERVFQGGKKLLGKGGVMAVSTQPLYKTLLFSDAPLTFGHVLFGLG